MGVTFNKLGEVADYPAVSQFESGESAYECGFFTAFLQAAAGEPGRGPRQNAEWIDKNADNWYTIIDGLNIASNTLGINQFQFYYVLSQAGVVYRPVAADLASIAAWVQNVGAAVCLSVVEDSVLNPDSGDKTPYSWKPFGNHIITVSGIRKDGNLIVRDTANVAAANGGGLSVVNAKKLKINNATAIFYNWLPTIPAGYNPISGPSLYKIETVYTVGQGDTLSAIGSHYGVSWSYLYSMNEQAIEADAHAHGHPSSQDGNVIYPGLKLVV